MKTKVISALLALVMMLGLFGCSSPAKEAVELINAIGDEVTLESEEAIFAARAAFDALSEKQQEELLDAHKQLRRAEHSLQYAKDAAFAADYALVVDVVAAYNDNVFASTQLVTEIWNNVGKEKCPEYMLLLRSVVTRDDFDTVYGAEADSKRALAVEGIFGPDADYDSSYYQAMAMTEWYGGLHSDMAAACAEVEESMVTLLETHGEAYAESIELLQSYLDFSRQFELATYDFTDVKSETAEDYITFMQFFLSMLQEQQIACLESAV